MLDPMDYYRMQMESPDFALNQADPSSQYPTAFGPQTSASPVMRMAAAKQSPAYTPSSGSQMEADSRDSIDKIIGHMAQQRAADRQNDRNMQWMSFFSKIASSKNPSILGGLGEGAQALTDTTGQQATSNKALDRAYLEDQLKTEEWKREQARLEAAQKSTEAYQRGELGLKAKELELGKYLPVKDAFGNVTSILDARTGKIISTSTAPADIGGSSGVSTEHTDDPQIAAQQILDEVGTPPVQVATRQDITGRNAQAKAYNDQALAAKKVQQELDKLDAQTGKYTPGKVANTLRYGPEAAMGREGTGVTARIEADKASKNLANAFMQANVGAKGSGIRMVEFDAGAVPNADMTDEARSDLIKSNKAVADSQIQRNVISNLYPRMHLSNVNAIMDNYEEKNPPKLPNGKANPNWLPYKEWLKAGRPNTTVAPVSQGVGTPGGNVPLTKTGGAEAPDYSHLWGQ